MRVHRRTTSDRLAPILVLGAALAAFPTAAGHFFGGEEVTFGGGVHFYGVGVTAGRCCSARRSR